MNKYYVIVPVVLLGVFVFFYRGALDEMEHKEKTRLAQIAAEKAIEDAHRKEVEDRASADAAARQKERDKVEAEKRLKKEQDYNDAMAKLKKESDGYSLEVDKLTKESAELEIALVNGRILRDKTNREVFDLNKQIELAKVGRRNAELEIQRLIEIVGIKTGSSSLASMPPLPPIKK